MSGEEVQGDTFGGVCYRPGDRFQCGLDDEFHKRPRNPRPAPDSNHPDETFLKGMDTRARSPTQRGVFLLCRSCDRVNKEAGILKRFEERIETRPLAMTERCAKQKRTPAAVERDVGRLRGQNTRAARLFDVRVERREADSPDSTGTKSPRPEIGRI